MGGDDAKKVILARRARFIAAALTGLAVPGCGKTTGPVDNGGDTTMSSDAGSPRPCLSTPAPCLSVYVPQPPPPDAGAAAHEPDCTPPYAVDAKGLKHFKPECL